MLWPSCGTAAQLGHRAAADTVAAGLVVPSSAAETDAVRLVKPSPAAETVAAGSHQGTQ